MREVENHREEDERQETFIYDTSESQIGEDDVTMNKMRECHTIIIISGMILVEQRV